MVSEAIVPQAAEFSVCGHKMCSNCQTQVQEYCLPCQKPEHQGEAETATGKASSFERNERRRESTFIRMWTCIGTGHKSNENNGKKFISEP